MNEKIEVNVIGKIISVDVDEQEDAIKALFEGDVNSLVELCRKYFKTLGTVPKMDTEDDKLVIGVVQFKNLETRRYATFEQAFDVVNNWPLKDLDPTIYIYRPKGKYGNRWVEASQFHLQAADDPEISRCRAVKSGRINYQLVLKPKPLLQSRICTNCLQTKSKPVKE